jgi:hypothetical protein
LSWRRAASEPGDLKKPLACAGGFCNETGARQELAAFTYPVEYQLITNHAYNANRDPVSIFPDQRYRDF